MRRYWNPPTDYLLKRRINPFDALEDNKEGQDNNRTKKVVQEEEVDHLKKNNKSTKKETLKQNKQQKFSIKD